MKKLLLGALMLTTVSSFAQTKKVILEDFTGTWCGWCPEGTVALEAMKTANPTNLITIATHAAGGDPMIVPDGTAIVSMLKQTSYPGGAVDRFLFPGEAKVPVGRNKWSGYFSQRAATSAIVSVGFTNKKFNTTTQEYECDVNIEFTSAPATGVPVVYTVYVLEDSIPATIGTAYEQDNYSSSVQGGASPLANWYHNYTLRDALTGATGDQITSGTIAVNTKYTKTIKFKPTTGWDKDQLHLVAFVHYNGDSANKFMLNAEQVKNVGKTFFPTGIEETVKGNVEIMNVNPNPASLNSVVKIAYNTNQSTVVSMKVYNLVGQMVAQPYTSREVEGEHIIDWKPADNNLTPGIYLVEVSTQYGKQVQRVSLY
jgi:thiol-disulfide isomerase/thioredoxin